MAVNFVARKCACGGKLEFDALKKIWICKYCGTVVEREATFDKIHVDGIEGISDVVRQTLMDVANHKMESAARNLEDCERKNHKHVGTIIAHISYNLANISLAKSQDEARGSLDKVKVYAKRLQEEFPNIDAEEINLYEAFGEGVADIYSNLMVVFDTLGDSGRVEYVFSKLRPEEVFSPYANKALLKIAIKQGKLDTVDAIVRNIGHLDRKSSLQEILDSYPDNEKKTEIIAKLFDASTAEALTKRYFEGYFENSHDSVETKSLLIDLLNTTDIHCSADSVIKSMANQLGTYDLAKRAFGAVYGKKISDQETEGLLVFCLMVNKLYEVQAAYFDTLIEKNVFVALNGRTVISFMDSSAFPTEQKADVIQKMLSFQIDNKALDAVYNYYLNNNNDVLETRMRVIDIILHEGSPITANTVKNYVLNTTTDEEYKLEVIKRIFSTGINKTYLGDLLSEYILKSKDSEEQKKCISDYLIGAGFKVDSSVMMEYVSSDDSTQDKIDKMKRLISNGTTVKADTLDSYLISLSKPEDFSEEIFNLLTQNNYSISFGSYAKYVLECRDIDKLRHNEKLLRVLSGDKLEQRTNITHCGKTINCNIAQAYILNAQENYENAKGILAQILSYRVKLTTDISVNGMNYKFKKYIGDHKNDLSPLALQLCEENRMFSLF